MIEKAGKYIKSARRVTAFTGAGISVESGIPPFRGENGFWEKYNPEIIHIDFLRHHPDKSWVAIRDIFYRRYNNAEPNEAHRSLANMEVNGYLHATITLNIDSLHQKAGSSVVYEFHGSLRDLVCLDCSRKYPAKKISFEKIPPICMECGGVLKPDFVFFGESIDEAIKAKTLHEAQNADVFLVVGTSGEIQPSASIPYIAKANGAVIIEVNPNITKYTETITDIILQGNATEIMRRLMYELC